MAIFLRTLRWLLTCMVVLVVAWAFFDVGRRYVQHRRDLVERPVELTVMHWGDPTEDKIVADLTVRFQAEHPDVRITRINPGAANFGNKLKTMMAADSAPDVFYLPPALLPELAHNKLIAPLDGYFDKEPDAWKADFWPILLKAFHYDNATSMLGRGPLYALPKDFTTAVFYINTDLFDQAGVDWHDIQKNGWDWKRFEAETKKVRELNGTPAYQGREIYGSLLQTWSPILQSIVWTYGGDLFKTQQDGTPDFTRLALTEAPAQSAIELVRRLRLVDGTSFNVTGIAKDGGEEFKRGNIGCIGPVGHWLVPQYQDLHGFRWEIVPVPSGTTKASATFYTGWTMSSHTPHADKAYELLRFLCGREGQVQQARAGLAIPSLQSVAHSDDFIRPPTRPVHNEQAFLDAIPFAKLAQLPEQPEFVQILDADTNLAMTAGRLSSMEAAKKTEADWAAELKSPLRAQTWPTMPWLTILTSLATVLAIAIGILFIRAKREKLGAIDRAGENAGFMFVAPWVVGFIIFTAGPMVVSLLLAFSQWSGMVPFGQAKFVGIANFKQLFTYDPLFAQSLKVTAYFVILGVPISQLAALLIAMLMNQRVRGIAIFRTVYFIPSVVSGAALAVLWLQLFNDQYGLINRVLAPITHLFGKHPPNWFGYDISTTPSVNDAARWAVPGFVLMGLWGVGSGMLIYLAGLKGINPSLYEAARIDGAGPLRRTWNVTIPMLSPLIFYNLVMGIIGSFQIFTQAYIMTDPNQNENATLFYVLNLYRQAFELHNMGYASAMAWVLFLIVLALTLLVFKGSKKLVYYEGLK